MIARDTERNDGADSTDPRLQWFRDFSASTEPLLRRALVAAYGADLGLVATAEAFAWAWEHRDRMRSMSNPAGYLWRVGQTAARCEFRHQKWELPEPLVDPKSQHDKGRFEPALAEAMASLSPRQRVAVILVHGHGFSLSEVAQQMRCRIRTVRIHLDRGMDKLRRHMGVRR